MKKILFFVITVILFGTMVFAQDKQDKQEPQTQPTQQTEQALPAQPIQSAEQKAPTCQPIPSALQEGVVTAETNLGRIYIARDFVHADLDYKKGNYNISLVEKDGGFWFKIFNNKKELLFAELAVVKPYEGKAKQTRMRVRKEFLKDYEYFRVTVIKPESHMMLYFMIKQKEVPAPATTPSPTEKQPEELKVEEIEM